MRYLDRDEKQNFRNLIQESDCQTAAGGHGLPEDDAAYGPERIGPQAQSFRRVARMATDPAWSLPRLDKQRIAATYRYLSQSPEGRFARAEWCILQAAAVDLIEHDCHAELAMYGEFRELRHSAASLPFPVESRSDWLRYKREAAKPARGRRFLGMRRSKVGR